MLIGNYSVLLKNPGRNLSGVAHSTTRAAFNSAGSTRCFYNNVERQLASVPNGTNPPVSWVIPQKSGGIACRTGAQGRSTIENGNLAGGLNAESDITGSGDITLANILYAIVASATITASGDISSELGGTLPAEANLTGSGDILANIIAAITMVADLNGQGDVNAELGGALQSIANLLGSGDLSADITGRLDILADLTGSGTITESTINSVWSMVSSIITSADVSADIIAKGNIIGLPEGYGDLLGNPSAKASMGADITVTGEFLTTSNVGDIVLQSVKPDLEILNDGVKKASLAIPHSTDLT